MPTVQSQSASSRPARAVIALGMAVGMMLMPVAVGAADDRFGIDWDAPITVRAAEAWTDSEQKLTRLDGQIVFNHHQWRLQADHAEVFGALDAPGRVVIDGVPATIVVRETADRARIQGSGRSIEYSRDPARLVLSGQAVLTEGRRSFHGEHLEYDLDTRRMTSKGPVRMRFEPAPRP